MEDRADAKHALGMIEAQPASLSARHHQKSDRAAAESLFADVAMACNAHGVHLRDRSIQPEKFARPDFLVTVSCHGIEDAPNTAGAGFVLLAPIFKPLSKMAGRPALGTWQGLYLFEHRRRSHLRELALHVIGE